MQSTEPDQRGRDEAQSPVRQPQRVQQTASSQHQQGNEARQRSQRPIQQSGEYSSAQQSVQEPSVKQSPTQPANQQAVGQMTQRPRALHEDVSQQAFNAESQLAAGPAVDVFDSAEKIVVVIDLPGYDPETIDLQAADQSLLITAERTLDDEEVSARSIQRERLPQIERAVDLPAGVDLDAAVATCENGVCRVTLPKAENARRKKIAVESGAT